MSEVIPLFPLGTVLFPGVVLPLHIFEPRYRLLVRHLMDRPEGTPREFGVIGIRQGHEVGRGEATALFEVGCTAELREVRSYPDGTCDIATAGRRRFRLLSVDTSAAPYLCATVEWMPEVSGVPGEADLLARSVAEVFGSYVRLLAGDDPSGPADLGAVASGDGPGLETDAADDGAELPDDPLALSHLVAASAPLTIEDRQDLLTICETVGRLRLELRLLKREATMLRAVRAVPVPLAELRVPLSPN